MSARPLLWTPNGSIVRQELQTFIGAELRKQGYSPGLHAHIGKPRALQDERPLYYKDAQFPPSSGAGAPRAASEGCSCAELTRASRSVSQSFADGSTAAPARPSDRQDRVMDADKLLDGFMLKPMNCPHHIKIFASQPHSIATCRSASRSSARLPLGASPASSTA